MVFIHVPILFSNETHTSSDDDENNKKNKRQTQEEIIFNAGQELKSALFSFNHHQHHLETKIPNTTDTTQKTIVEYSHRNVIPKYDLTRSQIQNSIPLDTFLENVVGWKRRQIKNNENNGEEKSSSFSSAQRIIQLDMLAELNPSNKYMLKSLDFECVHKIIQDKVQKEVKKNHHRQYYFWIPQFRPLSNKWLFSYLLDRFHYNNNKNNISSQTASTTINTDVKKKRQQNSSSYYCRSWILSCSSDIKKKYDKHNVYPGKVYYTIASIVQALESYSSSLEEKEKSHNNIDLSNNDWIPQDGYYVKPGGSKTGGGNNVKFAHTIEDVKVHLLNWMKNKRQNTRATCIVQQAVANRRRMLLPVNLLLATTDTINKTGEKDEDSKKTPTTNTVTNDNRPSSIFELRVFCVITGKDFSKRTNIANAGNITSTNHSSDNSNESSILPHTTPPPQIKDGSIYIHTAMRVKTVISDSSSSEKEEKVLLLNKRQIEKDKHENKIKHFSCSITDLCNAVTTTTKNTTLVSDDEKEELLDMKNKIQSVTIPGIVQILSDTVQACCFPSETFRNSNTASKNCNDKHSKEKENNNNGISDDDETQHYIPSGTLIVGAFDFIVDTNGNPILLEVNVKPWLRWCGIGTKEAYPALKAREIAKDFFVDLVHLFESYNK